MQLCIKNANEHLAQNAGRLGREFAALEELAQLLGLPQAPEYIESYDISHTFGADNVAGMVVFHNGRPMKKAYKKFAIKGFDGQNDVGSMQEVLQRRFTHYREDPEGSTFKILPDLILLDGGDAQVHAVLPVLAGMHIDVPVFGMVKDSKHRTRAISTGGGEIQTVNPSPWCLPFRRRCTVLRSATTTKSTKNPRSIPLYCRSRASAPPRLRLY